jgi:hypothetical protein
MSSAAAGKSWADLHPKKQKRVNKQALAKRAADLGQPDAKALWQACPGCATPIERTGKGGTLVRLLRAHSFPPFTPQPSAQT